MPKVSDDFMRDADASIARVEQQIAAAQEQAKRGQQFQRDVAEVRATASSPRRELRVTVDASGRLLDADLSDAAMDLSPQALSRMLVDTARAAQRQAGEQAVRIAADLFGEHAGATERLRTEIADALPQGGGTNVRWS